MKKELINSMIVALIIAFVCFMSSITIYYLSNDNKKERIYDLEIYTYKDIIYINHLCVTFESKPIKMCFDTNEELKEYVSDLTVNHVLEHRKEITNEF